MRKFLILFVGCLLCISIFLAMQAGRRKSDSEVIRIYKATPYQPKRVGTPQTERTETLTDATLSDDGVDAGLMHRSPSPLLSDENGDSEAEKVSGESIADLARDSQISDLIDESVENEPAEAMNLGEGMTEATIPYSELSKLVIDAYELEEVLNDYGVYVDEGNGGGRCPFCAHPEDFQVMTNAKTGRRDSWCCFTCSNLSYSVIDFVSKMEGIDEFRAAALLAERAGLLE